MSDNKKHGLYIGIERIDSKFFIVAKAQGKLTHEDYKKIIPLIDSALNGVKDDNVNFYMDASELEGWELRAAWDDFKVGLKHGSQFKKIAILTNKKYLEVSSKVVSWFMHGEVKTFQNEADAKEWLKN